MAFAYDTRDPVEEAMTDETIAPPTEADTYEVPPDAEPEPADEEAPDTDDEADEEDDEA